MVPAGGVVRDAPFRSLRLANQEDGVSIIRSERSTVRSTGPEWRSYAACRLMPAEMFFPVGTTGMAVEDVAEAKGVCTHCEVRSACLNFAIETRQAFGIWGGTDEDERREMARLRRRGAR